MKRLISFLAVLALALGCCSAALAAKVTITKQPETRTVKAGGTVSFSVKAKNTDGESITWYFVNPDTGEEITGRKLPSAFKGLRVSTPNGKTIKLVKVPEEMHGWFVYCRIGPKNGGLTTDTVRLLIAGMPEPEQNSVPKQTAEPEVSAKAEKEDEVSEPASVKEPEKTEEEEEEPVAKAVTIRGSKVDLYALDAKGNVTGGAVRELTFENGSADFFICLPEGSEGTIQYVTIDNVRLTPEGETTGMSVRGWPTSATVKIKTVKEGASSSESPAAEPAVVDESDLVSVSCTRCRFTGGGNSYVESGRVPRGTTVTVIASGGDVAQGYSVNGSPLEHAGEASFKLTVDGDTEITMNKMD